MKLPDSWKDKSLLHYEPFLSVFKGWQIIRGGRASRQAMLESLGKQVLESPDCIEAAKKWLELAFVKHKDDPPHPHLDKSSVQIFVEFYLCLSQSPESATAFIGQQRRQAGFSYHLSNRGAVVISSRAVSSFQGPETVPPQALRRNPSRGKILSKPLPEELAKPVKSLKRSASAKLSSGRPPKLVAVESVNPTQSLKIKKEIVTEALQAAPELKCEGNIRKQSKKAKKKKNVILSLTDRSDVTFTHGADVKPPIFTPHEASNPVELATTEDPPSMQIDLPSVSMSVDLPPMMPAMAPPVENKILPSLDNALPQHIVKDEHSELTTAPVFTEQLASSNLYTFKEDDDMNLVADLGMPPLPDKKFITVPLTVKPRLPSYPPIWAQSRQEVCESFDWFRSYQSGVYHAHGIVKGYLLSAYASKRDIFEDNGKLIISHGGGKAESLHTRSGQTTAQQADDQLAQDKSVRALLKNYRESRPIVLLIDDKYVLFPYDLAAKDVTYAVLGFYTIAYAWAEYQPANNERGRVIRYKFAFQWCDGQGEPWWILKPVIFAEPLRPEPMILEPSISMSLEDAQSPSRRESQRRPVKLVEYDLKAIRQAVSEALFFLCSHCQERSPQIYLQNWTCLNAACPVFWTLPNGKSFHDNLTYDRRFFQLSEPIVLPRGFEKLEPPQPAFKAGDSAVTNYAFSRGWHCRSCGRLSCRYKWEHWECMNCKNILEISGKIRAPNEFWNQAVPSNYKDHFIARTSGVTQKQSLCFSHGKGFGQTQTFILPEGRGFIHHIQSGNPLGRADADIIFREYQEQASNGSLAFRRWPLRSHKCRGPLLTNYFSQNSGEPYQYVGGTANTVPFDQAPSAVVKARELIQIRLLQALKKDAVFNEVLSAAYMERQKMAFHNDNEIGLGPLVAGLSLGSPALMHFRLHAKHDPNREHKGIIMSFVLRHGDVLVMDGAGVQEYYEHTVVPSNFRVAATARFINPNHPQQIRTKLTKIANTAINK